MDAFKGQPDFLACHYPQKPKLWNDHGKVRTNYYWLRFGDAHSNSTDPLVTLLEILKDGKLGTQPVDNKTAVLTEYVSGKLNNFFIGNPVYTTTVGP